MPYYEVENLPDRITRVLPKRAQEIFADVFNQSWQDGYSETSCFRIAWNAVKQAGYVKGQDGRWSKAKKSRVDRPGMELLQTGVKLYVPLRVSGRIIPSL